MEEEQLNHPTGQLNKRGDRRGTDPKSLRNLERRKSWQPGHSGNPKGRSLKSRLDEELDKVPTMERDGFDGRGQPNAYWIIRNQVRDAREGDTAARKEIWERRDGRVTEKHEVELTEPAKYINVVTPRAVGISEN